MPSLSVKIFLCRNQNWERGEKAQLYPVLEVAKQRAGPWICSESSEDHTANEEEILVLVYVYFAELYGIFVGRKM